MKPIESFQIFNSIKLHFTTTNYDYFKYNGKTSKSGNMDLFEKRKDKYHFYKIVREYDNEIDFIDLVVSNFLYEDKIWIGDLLDDNAKNNLIEYHKSKNTLIDIFKKDCEYLSNLYPNPKDMIKCEDGNYPMLLKHLLRKDITIYTVCILSKIVGFIDVWNVKIIDDIVWPKISMKIVKFAPFLKIEYNAYKDIMKEIF